VINVSAVFMTRTLFTKVRRNICEIGAGMG